MHDLTDRRIRQKMYDLYQTIDFDVEVNLSIYPKMLGYYKKLRHKTVFDHNLILSLLTLSIDSYPEDYAIGYVILEQVKGLYCFAGIFPIYFLVFLLTEISYVAFQGGNAVEKISILRLVLSNLNQNPQHFRGQLDLIDEAIEDEDYTLLDNSLYRLRFIVLELAYDYLANLRDNGWSLELWAVAPSLILNPPDDYTLMCVPQPAKIVIPDLVLFRSPPTQHRRFEQPISEIKSRLRLHDRA